MNANDFVLDNFSGVIGDGIENGYIESSEEIQELIEDVIQELLSEVDWEMIFNNIKTKKD